MKILYFKGSYWAVWLFEEMTGYRYPFKKSLSSFFKTNFPVITPEVIAPFTPPPPTFEPAKKRFLIGALKLGSF